MTFLALAENSIQLVPDGTLILHIALILVMVSILNAIFFKPIGRILSNREACTGGRSQQAHEIMQRVGEKLSNYERSLREARVEGYRLLEQERALSMRQRQLSLDAARESINRLVNKEKGEILEQSADARRTLEQEARRVAYQIGTQILGRPVGNGTSPSLQL
ncbi:MAG: hypothetical protein H0T92_23220 [Pyrinomonadaceae bacterium]|nr:hypothetical protein [Pyrinomonadaceae bacterium]